MFTFEKLYSMGHEEVVIFCEPTSGLKAIVAIHDTTLGPALGGTRMWPYATEEEAVEDVLRLSKGMTYKAAISGLNLGGGKAVIIGDPKKDKSEAEKPASEGVKAEPKKEEPKVATPKAEPKKEEPKKK